MKKPCTTAFAVTLTALLFSLSSCASGGANTSTSGSSSVAVEKPAQVNAPAPLPPPPPPNPYFSGEGGKGISIAILPPKASGLGKEQEHLPSKVQGEFVYDFISYSAMSVLDRQNLDSVYTELYSGYYDDNAKVGYDWGNLTPPTHIMGGNIFKTPTGYTLQIQITKTADKMTVASYSGNCTFVELDNFAGVRRASLDLLQKMGVKPTERTQTELAGAAATSHVSAQTALAQGITAKQRGGVTTR